MSAVIETEGLGKRYRQRWALADGTLSVPGGHVVGLGLERLASHGIREAVSYQPASRYWPLQGIETGILLAVALALAGCSFWRLGRRRS